MDNEQQRILNELNVKIVEEFEMKDTIKLSEVQTKTIWEKLDYYEANSVGKIINPYLNTYGGEEKVFETVQDYLKWKDTLVANIKEELKSRLTPIEYNITQNKATERPFTGLYANHYDVGIYSCKVCTQKLFSNNHKVRSDAGWALFWNYLPYSINLKQDFLDRFSCESRTGIFSLQHDNLSKPIHRMSCTNVRLQINYIIIYNNIIFIV